MLAQPAVPAPPPPGLNDQQLEDWNRHGRRGVPLASEGGNTGSRGSPTPCEAVPSMPVVPNSRGVKHKHRFKLARRRYPFNALVARPVGKKEIASRLANAKHAVHTLQGVVKTRKRNVLTSLINNGLALN